ncbi:hypothetical protein [Streptomyces cellostaticus]|uniref:hypothetical protein n=1 Tax=Streptomyces cellostaticus TaxID=67285 RepID=UPI002026648F|nr:hypothetical protein [Streptomyces cellostaticus]
MREFAREFRELVGGPYSTSGAFLSNGEMSKLCSGKRLVGLDTLRSVLQAKAAEPEDIEYWELRWTLVYQYLTASGSSALPRRQGEAEAASEIATQKADRMRAVAELAQAREDSARQQALRAVEHLFSELDQSLPNSRRKSGHGPAACWFDLTDYLRRLVLLFTDPKTRCKEHERQSLSTVLSRVVALADMTGVAGWRTLAEEIAGAYDEAHREGWEIMPSPGPEFADPCVYYVDRYSDFRAQAGKRAAQLARESVFLAEEPDVLPPSPIDLDRYDPPRSHYRHAAPVSAVCAGALPLALWMTDAPLNWAMGLYSLVVFLGMWLACLVRRVEARPDQD